MIPLSLIGCLSPVDPDHPATSLAIDPIETAVAPGTPPPGVTPAGPGCQIGIVSSFPVLGSDDVFVDTDVQVRLDVADPTARIDVVDPAGVAVLGDTVVVEDVVTWIGDRLLPRTVYRVLVQGACDPVEGTLTTNDTGSPLLVPVDGGVYQLDLTQGHWVAPPGIGGILGAAIGGTLLISPEVLGDRLRFHLGMGDDQGSQDLCEATTLLPEAFFDDPFFELEGAALTFRFAEVEARLNEGSFTGAFGPLADRIDGLVIRGTLDTRSLSALIVPDGPEDLVCQVISALGAACGPCPDGVETCLDAHVDGLVLPLLPGRSFEVRSAQDVLDDVACTP